MTATAHALVGAAIAAKIQNPALALPIAFVSHFVFDKLPHWDPMTNHDKKTKKRIFWETVTDVILSYLLVTVFFFLYKSTQPVSPLASQTLSARLPQLFYFYVCAFAAQLPDWLEIPYLFNLPDFLKAKWNYRLQHWVHDVGFDSRTQAPWGVVTQVAVSGIFLLWAILP